jgi:hypothetical protein
MLTKDEYQANVDVVMGANVDGGKTPWFFVPCMVFSAGEVKPKEKPKRSGLAHPMATAAKRKPDAVERCN